jgi:hypothetical protein
MAHPLVLIDMGHGLPESGHRRGGVGQIARIKSPDTVTFALFTLR